jgi:RNase H-fold protein (predicted Holliday junction resolvase)
LTANQAGDLAMTVDASHPGDSINRRDNLPVLIVDVRLATQLAQRVLDFPSPSGAGAQMASIAEGVSDVGHASWLWHSFVSVLKALGSLKSAKERWRARERGHYQVRHQ